MLTPVFHPNIAPHAICVGDHWSAGEPIASIVARIGEILAFQSYNVKSPLNGEAARWVEQNIDQLPLDNVSMVVDTTPHAPAGSSPPSEKRSGLSQAAPTASDDGARSSLAAAGAIPEAAAIEFRCSGCGARYGAKAESAGKRMRCKKCQAIMLIPTSTGAP
jgi:DNA-directed RNA polymerase subunit RPC12/RpoP